MLYLFKAAPENIHSDVGGLPVIRVKSACTRVTEELVTVCEHSGKH